MENLIELLYISRANQFISDDALLLLLNQSRNKNIRLSITGMLVYKDTSFIQILEGPKTKVEELFDVIKKDERHYNVRLLLARKLEIRNFSNWSMGFMNLNHENLTNIEGFTPFFQDSFNLEDFLQKPSLALSLLLHFRQKS